VDEKLATLIGLLLSDGSVFFDRSKKVFCIQFTNKVDGLREVFKNLMKECFGITSFFENHCKGAVSVRVFSNKVANFLFNLSPTFRKLPCDSFPRCNGHSCIDCTPVIENSRKFPPCRIPEEILDDMIFSINFLRGFASGDGSIFFSNKHRVVCIELTCSHPILKAQLVVCLKKIGINCFTKRDGIIIASKSGLKRFHQLVGFLPESIVCNRSSKWFGVPKNKVLEIALEVLE
jgi:hypothetical protein